MQNEVVQLTTECRAMEHQWRIGKESYHRDYVVAAAKAAAAAAAKANAELKGTHHFYRQSTYYSLVVGYQFRIDVADALSKGVFLSTYG